MLCRPVGQSIRAQKFIVRYGAQEFMVRYRSSPWWGSWEKCVKEFASSIICTSWRLGAWQRTSRRCRRKLCRDRPAAPARPILGRRTRCWIRRRWMRLERSSCGWMWDQRRVLIRRSTAFADCRRLWHKRTCPMCDRSRRLRRVWGHRNMRTLERASRCCRPFWVGCWLLRLG